MTHFLEVGSMREDLHDILESAHALRRLLMMTPDQRLAMEQARLQQGDMTTMADDIKNSLSVVLERAEDLINFLEQFESAPIIYTGEGSTADVLAMLEHLLNASKNAETSP